MSVPKTQKALFLPGKGEKLVIETTGVYTPGPGEILVRHESIGLNPADWILQETGMFIEKYPFILGLDVAGVVVKLGEGVTRFNIGDRVLRAGGFKNDMDTFQEYSVYPAEVVAKIPENLSFDQAATIPVCFDTAAIGLYQNFQPGGGAGLYPPWLEGGRNKYSGQPIVVFGGSSSLGQFTIQLAKLSGFNPIIATVSPRNFDLVKSLGATNPIDRNLPLTSIHEEIRKITSKPITIVYSTIPEPAIQEAAQGVVSPGGTLVTVGRPIPEDKRDLSKKVMHPYGSVLREDNRKFGVELYEKLSQLIESGEVKPTPVEYVAGGLGAIQEQLYRLKKGEISGRKLVVRPSETS
ncbi:GroES-like protein [Abortiporus biennis]|nr:GroES-like protein [Abortiporus biennis]